MKLIFMGTSSFSVLILEALLSSQFELLGVITQPDRPAGRGKKLSAPPVKKRMTGLEIPVWQPKRVNDPGFVEQVRSLRPQAIVVASFGQIIKKELLQVPVRGFINVHPSLLPKYRGADPIRWTLLNGEEQTGVTIMLMDEGMDSGPILSQKTLKIEEKDNAATLEEKLGLLGGELLVDTLDKWLKGIIVPQNQDANLVSYAPKLSKEMARVDWTRSALFIVNQIRAFSPRPGAWTYLRGKRVKILSGKLYSGDKSGEPGKVVEIDKDKRLIVATGEGLLQIELLQPEGGKVLTGREFCCGYRIQKGEILE